MKNQADNIYTKNNITIFHASDSKIGYFARTTTKGQEFDMVKKYISFIVKKYSKLKRKEIAIFIEPQIYTGYPDIVIVEFYPLKNDIWDEQRRTLTITDIKILFYIQTQKNASIDSIIENLGYSLDVVNKSIKKLYSCKLVHLSKSQKYVRNTKLENYSKIRKIIAIEAKIDKWQEAIRQANNNVCFSTESYILMNKESCSKKIIDTCKEIGIGIILVNGKIQTIQKSTERTFPVSYASLQFNEWIMRNKHRRN